MSTQCQKNRTCMQYYYYYIKYYIIMFDFMLFYYIDITINDYAAQYYPIAPLSLTSKSRKVSETQTPLLSFSRHGDSL